MQQNIVWVGYALFVICFHVGGPVADSGRHFLPAKLGFYQINKIDQTVNGHNPIF